MARNYSLRRDQYGGGRPERDKGPFESERWTLRRQLGGDSSEETAAAAAAAKEAARKVSARQCSKWECRAAAMKRPRRGECAVSAITVNEVACC